MDAEPKTRKPAWLKIPLAAGPAYGQLRELFTSHQLHTVCEEARCPNRMSCWSEGTATFMILGRICTRACRFCDVTAGHPGPVDPFEPARVADAIATMHVRHAVITSVARDDLPDGGASAFAATIRAIHQTTPEVRVEVLIPDFGGNESALRTVLEATPDVLNHNVETVRRLSDHVRSKAKYDRSLQLLERSKAIAPQIWTKSSIMVGLGETFAELCETMDDLRRVDCDIVTFGQYLQPAQDKRHLPVKSYYPPESFAQLAKEARQRGFRWVESGPLVRSSYHAGRAFTAEAGGKLTTR